MARRSKLTPAKQEQIMELIRQGCPQAVAAARSGLHGSTFYDWSKRGREAKSGKHRVFWEALQEAQAIAEATLVLQLRAHGTREWRATAWLLERRFSDRWKPRQAVEQTIMPMPGAPQAVIVQLGGLTPEQLSAMSGVDLEGMELPTDGGPDTDTDAEPSDE